MKDSVLSVLRHVLTIAGAGLISKGVVSEADFVVIVGGVVTAASVAWEWFATGKLSKAAH